MGVRGLQTFLKNNPQILEQIEVSNTSLVIDANNLLCLIYTRMCLTEQANQYRCDLYMGDMVAYAECIKRFFTSLEKCSITPILIFDGSVIGKKSTQDQLMLKEKSIYLRALDKFQAARTWSEDYNGDNLALPRILSLVFKTVISDLGYQSIITPYEADSHIARVANDLNCMVLTNDSDFMIYSIDKGFIMIDNFNYDNVHVNGDKHYIRGSVFRQDKLVKCLTGLRKESLPLLSVLLGNDYVEAGTFDRVLEYICGQSYYGPLVARTWAHRRIANLLSWLRDKSVAHAIDEILNQVHPNNIDKLRRTIGILLRNYDIEKTDNFEAELDEVFSSDADPQAASTPDLTPAKYLRRLFESHSLVSTALDMIFHNTHYTYAGIDDLQLAASSFVKYRPYSVAIALLRTRTYQGLTTYRQKIELERDAFHVYDRVKGEYGRVMIRPLEYLEGFGTLEHMCVYTLMTIEPPLKRDLLMSTFRFNSNELDLMKITLSEIFTGPYVDEATICLMLIKYIGLETKMSPKPQFVDAIVLTLFYYGAITGQLNRGSIKDSQLGHILVTLRPHSIKNNGKHYESSQPLYRRILHFISQLQEAFSSYCLLNGILNYVLPEVRLQKFFNGTLIARITKLLRLKELKLESLTQDSPIVSDICGSVKVMVHCEET